MISLSIIFLCITLVIGIGAGVFGYLIDKKYGPSHLEGYQHGIFFGVVLMFFLMVSFFSLDYACSPQAIDVYRNKTELKITKVVENDTIIRSDSTVVFKK